MEFIGTTIEERSFNRCCWGAVNLRVRLGKRLLEFISTTVVERSFNWSFWGTVNQQVLLGDGQSTSSVGVTCIGGHSKETVNLQAQLGRQTINMYSLGTVKQ